MHIKVFRNMIFEGYIKSVSYTNKSFKTTKDISLAKTYKSEIAVMGDIDFCSRVSKDFPVFTYE